VFFAEANIAVVVCDSNQQLVQTVIPTGAVHSWTCSRA
jgi:hypothetical protein